MTTLPFSEFLDTLRDRGFGIGLHEYVAAGRLLERWDSTNRDDLRNAFAALLARSEDDVRQIRLIYDEFYPVLDAPLPRDTREIAKTPVRRFELVRLLKTRWLWTAAVVALAAPIVWFVAYRAYASPDLPAVPAAIVIPPAPIPVAPDDVRGGNPYEVVPPEPDPSVPSPPSVLNWPGLAWLAAGALIVALASLWGRRMMRRARKWTADAWDAALEHLPGPFHSPLVLRDLVTHLPRADVEEAATLLGRTFSPDRVGQTLDVMGSLRQTVRSGMQPHLVFRPRRVQEVILVLQDVSQSMAPYQKRVSSLCRDLRRQGVALEMWYFDGDVGAPATRPFGAPSPLEQILAARHDHPVLILSAGFGVPATLATDTRWLLALRDRARRAWLNPVVDPDLWPASLHRLPLLVAPMTRAGLMQAARQLSTDDSGGRAVSIRAAAVAAHVTPDHIHQLRRLASLVPYPTPEVLEVLRQRFAPDIPESAVIYTVGARTASSDVPFQMTDDEIRALLKEVRAEAPALESQVRDYLLKVLRDSEPAIGSAAHLRWETSMSIHQVELADLRKTDGRAAIDRLRDLYHGPLWEEVRKVVAQQPSSGPAVERAKAAVNSKRGQFDPPAFAAAVDDPSVPRPPRWTAPRWREVVAAGLTALFVAFTGSLTGAFSSQAQHLRDAYQLGYVPGADANDPGQLKITFRSEEAGIPREVQLYRDADPIGPPIVLADNAASFVRLDSLTPSVFHVRGTLPTGAFALSNASTAPSVAVVIDAFPWANVTITAVDGRIQQLREQTPTVVQLPEGQYRTAPELSQRLRGRDQDDHRLAHGQQQAPLRDAWRHHHRRTESAHQAESHRTRLAQNPQVFARGNIVTFEFVTVAVAPPSASTVSCTTMFNGVAAPPPVRPANRPHPPVCTGSKIATEGPVLSRKRKHHLVEIRRDRIAPRNFRDRPDRRRWRRSMQSNSPPPA